MTTIREEVESLRASISDAEIEKHIRIAVDEYLDSNLEDIVSEVLLDRDYVTWDAAYDEFPTFDTVRDIVHEEIE